MIDFEVFSTMVSRRLFGKILLGAGLCRAGVANADTDGDPLLWDDLANRADRFERQYRADAQILFFGTTIYRRNDVGGGSAIWADAGEMRRKMEFIGFSNPERAAGLNRLGFIQEVSRPREFAYFGVMTSSPEESMDSARKALRPVSGEVAFTAINGRLSAGSADALIAQFQAPVATSVHNRDGLIRAARKALGTAVKRPLEFDPRTITAQPFLHSLFEALRQGANSTTYIYGSRQYSLTLRSASDEPASAAFREMKLLPPGGKAVRVNGKIRPTAGGKESEFHIWLEVGASRPVPLRIDYRPKGYLRLTFEALAPADRVVSRG